MGVSRSLRRKCDGEFPVYPVDDSRGWGVVRMVSFEYGVDKVAEGKWSLMEHPNGEPWYFQFRANFKTDSELPAGELSPTTITEDESKLNAGLFGKSATGWMDLDDPRRLIRHERFDPDKPLPPEDHIERAQAKVKLWSWPASRIDDGLGKPVYGDRAVRVYPKPS